MEKSRVLALCFLLLLSMFLPSVSKVTAQEAVQFSSLQETINNSEEGSVIYAKEEGTYYGLTKINKTLTLMGQNVKLDANGSQVGIIVSAPNVRLEGFEIQNAVRFGNGSQPTEISELWSNPEMEGAGIYIYCANNVVISNVTISDCYAGMGFTNSYNTKVSNSSINKTLWGIMLYCSDVEIFNSNIMDGLREYTAPDGRTQTGGGAICLHHYSEINLTYTTLLNNEWGICISPYVYYSSINHNNFIKNSHNICIHPDAQREVAKWTSNYWSDYSGTDLFSGPYQNETGSDGFGDTPYIIDHYNQDNYPLMEDPHFRPATIPSSHVSNGGGAYYGDFCPLCF